MSGIHKDIAKAIKEAQVIGRNRYNSLKKQLDRLNQTDVDELVNFRLLNKISVAQAEKEVEKYELKWHVGNKNASENLKEYMKTFRDEKQIETKEITKVWLWKEFLKAFKENENIEFKLTPETAENIKPIFYYFLGDLEKLKGCKNVSNLSKVDLSKGLLIIGNYGNGKTSVMKALEKVFKNTNLIFKGYNTNEAVTMYEACGNSKEKDEFMNLMVKGTRYFDDVKTERQASNYGKTEIFKEIFEMRNRNKVKTFITMNYREGNPNDLKDGLLEMGEKYGSRVYDRIFQDYIIIEFKGKSFRV